MTRVTGRHKVVHIIESLRPGDLKTGERLREQLGPSIHGPGLVLPVHFWREPTKVGVIERLRQIALSTKSTGKAPIVDLQMHGCLDYLQVTSLEHVTWAELKAPLAEINVASRLNLLVLVGACDGEALLHVLQAHEPAPVWGLIGPNRPALDQEVEAAHAAFYQTLVSTRNGDLAVRAMNAAADAVPGTEGDSPFHFFDAEWFFREVMQSYFRRHGSGPGLLLRVDRLAGEALQAAALLGASPEQLVHLAATVPTKLEAQLRDHQTTFDHFKGIFFLGADCPGEWSRFSVSLAECLSHQDA